MFFFFFKQKTAYEMRISDWSSDVCSSDLSQRRRGGHAALGGFRGLGANGRIGTFACHALPDGWRGFGVAQPVGQTLAVAARMDIDPLDRLPERRIDRKSVV